MELIESLADLPLERRIVRIPSGLPLLDVVFEGGLQLGRAYLFYGAGGTTKSTHIMTICSSFQESANGIVLYYDTEYSFDAERWKKYNLRTDRVALKKIGSVEDLRTVVPDSIRRAVEIATSKGPFPVMVVVDSFSLIPSEAEMKGSNEVAVHARALSSFARQLMPLMSEYLVTCIFAVHERQKMQSGGFQFMGAGKTYSSENIFKSFISFESRLAAGQSKKKQSTGVKIGFEVVNDIKKNKLGAFHGKLKYMFYYETGIDIGLQLVDALAAIGFVNSSSPQSFEIEGVGKVSRRELKELEVQRKLYDYFWEKLNEVKGLKQESITIDSDGEEVESEEVEEVEVDEE